MRLTPPPILEAGGGSETPICAKQPLATSRRRRALYAAARPTATGLTSALHQAEKGAANGAGRHGDAEAAASI